MPLVRSTSPCWGREVLTSGRRGCGLGLRALSCLKRKKNTREEAASWGKLNGEHIRENYGQMMTNGGFASRNGDLTILSLPTKYWIYLWWRDASWIEPRFGLMPSPSTVTSWKWKHVGNIWKKPRNMGSFHGVATGFSPPFGQPTYSCRKWIHV